MYNPDENYKKEQLPALTPRPQVNIMSEKARLKWYIVNSSAVRKRYGFAKTDDGKIWLEDKSKVVNLDPETKQMLREIYSELPKRDPQYDK